jgi:hypothetical protein
MNEYLYAVNSLLIAVILFLSMLLVIELGYRIGKKRSAQVTQDAKSHVSAIQSSIIGILALLLGFTFSLSLQRFDERSEAVVLEANAIGTTYLRAQMLPEAVRKEMLLLLRDYVDLRVQASHVTLAETITRQMLLAQAADKQTQIWRLAKQAVNIDPSPTITGLFIQSLNEMIDQFGARDAALNRHVPEVVLILLYCTFLIAGGIVGFSAGESNHRPSMVSYLMVALIVILVYIILDLDRPRRGLIEVSQKPLTDLQQTILKESLWLEKTN